VNLKNLTITESLRMLREKKTSASELVRDQLDHIEKDDPKIGAYLYVDKAGALQAAEERDRLGAYDLPLAGVPLAVKDVITTSDMPSTAGSKLLEGYLSPYDATVVRKLKEAGAILIGKTNCDEFAMGSSTENSAYQKTRNPWDLERVPGGSGGGSAAAVAADLAVAALGTDTGGSIRQPASFTGTVGLKPTYGLVSRFGLIALASSLDQIGPVTKTVEDSSRLLSVISGSDENDATSLISDPFVEADLKNFKLKGLRIGLPKEYFGQGVERSIRDAVVTLAEKLEEQGAKTDWVSLPSSEQALSVYYIILPSEASSNLARYDGVRFGRRESAASVLEIYLKTRSSYLGAEPKRRIMLGTYALSAGYYEAYYDRATRVQQQIRNDFDRAWQKFDLLVSPTTPTTAFKFGSTKTPLQMYMNDILTLPSNLAGNTALSVPIGLVEGLPVGLQIIGPQLAEKKVLQLGQRVEELAQFEKLEKLHESLG
jgi:aspartyl-tRNA(Asn)/glutamyl-tRNA(Gln) amidotransferase subunit A